MESQFLPILRLHLDDDLGLVERTNRYEIRAQQRSRLSAALCVYCVCRDQAALISPSCCNAVTPSSRPISSTIMPSLSFRTVVPVKCIFRPVAAGNDPTRKITERRTAKRATAFPTADHMIALGDEVGSAPEIEIRKR